MKEIINTKVIVACVAVTVLGIAGCSRDQGGMDSGADTGYETGVGMTTTNGGSLSTTNGGGMGDLSSTNQGGASMTNGFHQQHQPGETNNQVQPNLPPDSGAPGVDSGEQSGDTEDFESTPGEDQDEGMFEPDKGEANPTTPDQDDSAR